MISVLIVVSVVGSGEGIPGPVGEHSSGGGVTVTKSPVVLVHPMVMVSVVIQL